MLNPAKALRLDADHESAAVIGAAFECDLFRPLLQREALAADFIANAVGAPTLMVEQMLDCLVYMGAAKLCSGRYMLTAAWRRSLGVGYDEHRDAALRRLAPMRQWLRLGQASRNGGEDESVEDRMFRTGAGLESYLRGVLAFNGPMIKRLANELAPYLELLAHPRVADVGGGHAGYLLELMSRHLQVQGEVIDIPATTAVSQRMNADHPLRRRLGYIDADARALGGHAPAYEVVMVNDLLHSFSSHDKQAIAGSAFGIVRPGGLLAFTKFTHLARQPKRDNSMFSMKLYVHTNGQGYLESDEFLLELLDGMGADLIHSFRLNNKSGFIFRKRL